MPYDPTFPQANTLIVSAAFRDQFGSLFDLIQAVPAGPPGEPGPPFAQAVVDGVNTLNPGEPATVGVSFDGTNVHFTFGIPRGNDGSNGADGTSVSGAVIDGVTSLDPNQGATANVNFDTGGQILHFSFGIPRGQTGDPGPPGPQGPAFGNAVVDSVSTLDPGQPASAQAWFDGNVVHFTFGIPRGQDGSNGAEGPQGPPGEVSAAQLASAIGGTSSNSNGVATLGIAVSDPPTQGEMQQVVGKLDELILALRR